MDDRRAFTLIELLVVIAIIALLISILMPALAQANRQARAAACQSILSQWGKVFAMYTMDNNGYFASGNTGKMWTETVSAYTTEAKLRLCPMATKPASDIYGPNMMGSRYLAWGKFDSTYAQLGLEGVYGSYGMNGHVSNDPPGIKDMYGRNLKNNWRSCNVRGAHNIPLFMDCISLGGIPEQSDKPPQYEGDITFDKGYPDMKAFCIDRHNGGTNGLFVDFSVRKVGLKELWKLKWHRAFDINAHSPVWPEWMKRFKEY